MVHICLIRCIQITVNPKFGKHDSGSEVSVSQCSFRSHPHSASTLLRQATLWTLKTEGGCEASVTDYGATLVRMVVPDRDGKARPHALRLRHNKLSQQPLHLTV